MFEDTIIEDEPQYTYFVSYAWPKGVGHLTAIESKNKIDKNFNFTELCELIAKHKGVKPTEIVILNFILLD